MKPMPIPTRLWITAFSRWAVLLCAAILFYGCGEDSKHTAYRPEFADQPLKSVQSKKEYLFGVHPLHNPEHLFDVYGPIVDLLNTRIPEVHFTLEASRNYEEYEKKLYSRRFDLALPNPFQTVNSLKHGYRVFGKMGDDDIFRGIFIVRKDSKIRNIADLKGRVVSFPAKTALAATMMPQYFLHKNGLPLDTYEARYVGSQESSIMNVYLGNTATGATWPPPWIAFKNEHHDIADQLKILWMTDPLVNNSLVARDDFPADLLQKVSEVIFSLQNSKEGRDILARIPLSRFEAASDATYKPVDEFIEKFGKTVRSPNE